ncbi:MAG: phosphoglycerate kinase [Nitrospira sp.]
MGLPGGIKHVEEIETGGKRVFVRVDFNVPFKKGTKEISDDARITATLPTLKHLKRVIEMTQGHKSLIGVVLFGQTELAQRLSVQNREVREVVQRCELVTLPPLDNELEAFIQFKFARVGIDYKTIIDASGIEGIRAKLTQQLGNKKTVSYLYPLAVTNLLIGSMNLAAEGGFAQVDGDVVKEA